jgi:hypothetical protein
MDWWGNPCPVDTSEIDEEIYRRVRRLLEIEVEIASMEEADPGSIVNGGCGWPTLRREIRW